MYNLIFLKSTSFLVSAKENKKLVEVLDYVAQEIEKRTPHLQQKQQVNLLSTADSTSGEKREGNDQSNFCSYC